MPLKDNNEITVKLNATKQQMLNLLIEKGFELKATQYLKDCYFVPKTLNIKNNSVRNILSKAVIIRSLYTEDKNTCKSIRLCFKQKVFNNEDEIVEQTSYNIEIANQEDAKNFLNAIGYTQILNINEYEYQLTKDNIMFEIKEVVNGILLMEIETIEDSKFNSIEKIKQYLIELNLPVDYSNLFVKKAEIELQKVLDENSWKFSLIINL